MGNRAVITFGLAPSSPAVYIHWSGELASVLGFLEAAKQLGLTGCGKALRDDLVAKVLRPFFGNESVYPGRYAKMDIDNGDNGVYRVNRRFEIVERLHVACAEEVDEEKAREITAQILNGQPGVPRPKVQRIKNVSEVPWFGGKGILIPFRVGQPPRVEPAPDTQAETKAAKAEDLLNTLLGGGFGPLPID